MASVVRSAIGSFTLPTGGLNFTDAVSLPGGNTATTGNKILVAILNETARTVVDIADTPSTSFSSLGTSAGGAYSRVDFYQGTVAANTAGQNVIVELSGNTGDSVQVVVLEVSGLASDQSGAQNSNDTTSATMSHASSSLTPPNSNGLMIAGIHRTNGIYTDDTDFSSITTSSLRTFFGYIENPSAATNVAFTSEDNEDTTIKTCILVGAAAGGTVNTATLTSNTTIVDEPLDYWFANRRLDDSLTVSEGALIQSTIYNLLASDELTVIDELIRYARYNRLLQDSATITDGVVTSLITYLVFTSVLSSNVTVVDQGVVFRLFERMMDSGALTTDQALAVMLRTRNLLDGIDITDENLTALQRFRMLSDAIELQDALSSLVVTPTTGNPVIVIGCDQPKIEIGGYIV